MYKVGGSMRLIEKGFNLVDVNKLAITEASFIRVPKIHNIHTWFARRPCGIARVSTASAVLPADIDEKEFKQIVGLDRAKSKAKIIYMAEPNLEKLEKYVNPSEITVLDPMAGGGSIPLESARLGFRTIAMEYNPVAYLILKATVEYPANFGEELFNLALKEAKRFIKFAREKLGEFYTDAENYIFARGIRCPKCNGLIPVAGVFPEITTKSSYKKRFLKIEFDKDSKNFRVETTNEKQTWSLKKFRKGQNIFAQCPYCEHVFKLRGQGKDHAFAKWFKEHAKLMKAVVEDLHPVDEELEKKLLELHIPLVKQVGNEFVAIKDDEEEIEKFIKAFRELSNRIFELQSYIPMDEIPEENEWASTFRNLVEVTPKWYMLFNPRQLLILAELIRYVAERVKELYEEKGELGIASMLYIAFAIDKMVNYNNIATMWHNTRAILSPLLRGEQTLDFRVEYVEMVVTLPERSLEWALEPELAENRKFTKTAGGILPVLRFLTDQFKENKNENVRVILGDATKLDGIIDEKIDVINVDPPYYEQVIYTDKIEIFWVILRRALLPVLSELFKNSKLENWDYTSSKLPREKEVVARSKDGKRFESLFKQFVKSTYEVLKEEGYFIMWFTHPRAEAWYSVGESLYDAGYVVPKVYPIYTEMPTRYKKQVNQVAQQVTLAIVAKKGERKHIAVPSGNVKASLLMNEEFINSIRSAVETARKTIANLDITTADASAIVFSTAMGVITNYSLPFKAKFKDLYEPAITLSVKEFFTPLLEKVFKKGYIALDEEKAKVLLEKVEKRLLLDPSSRSFLSLWTISHVKMDGSLYEEPLNLSYDFAQMVSKLCGFDINDLKKFGLIRKVNSTYKLTHLSDYINGRVKADIKTFLKTSVGRAIYLTYLSATTGGTPAVRAREIVENEHVSNCEDEIEFDSSLALVLLSTAPDSEFEDVSKIDVRQMRKIISETLTHFILGDVNIEVRSIKRGIKTLEGFGV